MTTEEIKESVTFRAVVEMCGFHPTSTGFICCPFHKEKTPSFRIRPKTGICYGCGWEGDVFKFYMELNHCNFPAAFLALGGTYEHEGKSRREIAVEKAALRKQAALRAAKEREKKERLLLSCKRATEVYWEAKEAFEFAKALFPAFSDEWCDYLEDYGRAQIELSLAEEEYEREYG